MKKYIKHIISLVLVSLLLVGCGKEPHLTLGDIHTSYDEWAKAINLTSGKYFSIANYSEAYNEIYISCLLQGGTDQQKNIEGIKEILALAQRHNDFVDSNPNYFDKSKRIIISIGRGSLPSHFEISNGLRDKVSMNRLGVEQTSRLDFLMINHYNMPEYITNSDIQYNFKNVILKLNPNKGVEEKEDYIYVKNIHKCTNLIIDIPNSDELGKGYDYIKEYNNDVKIFLSHYEEDVEKVD